MAPDVFFLGEIPRNNDFENETHKGDSMKDDSAIAIILLRALSSFQVAPIAAFAIFANMRSR
jgi:hypothetical protein